MAATVARATLNPEAPIFIPSQSSQLSAHPCPDLPLCYMPQPNNTIFSFSTDPTYPFFLLTFFAPNISLNTTFIGRPPLFSAVPPQSHDKAFASHPGRVAGKEVDCMATNTVKLSSNRYSGGRNVAGVGFGAGCSFRENPQGKKAYRLKPRNCDDIRANFGDCPRTADRKKISRNEKTKCALPVSQDASCTTVMVRNIPSKYTREMLLEFLDRNCEKENRDLADQNSDEPGEEDAVSAFDFLYLPIDFNTGMNKGYAFVNFTTPTAARKFVEAADGQTWDLFNSNKIRQLARARLQGKEELVRHFENMGFPCQSDDVLPVCFSPPRDGSGRLVSETTVGRRMGRKKSGDVDDRSCNKI